MKRGLVFSKYGDLAASTRQRISQMQPYLAQAGISLEFAPLFDNAYLEQTLGRGERSALATLAAYGRRLKQLHHAKEADFVWIQYELFPYLPEGFEALIGSVKKPIILDYDDAIFHQYDTHPNLLLRGLLANKLKPLIARASLVMCGNRYLKDYMAPLTARAEIIPTVVDITSYQPAPAKAPGKKPTLGWIGSPSTWKYCAPLFDMLAEMVTQGKLEVLVVGAGPAADTGLPFEFRPWSEAREVADIQAMDLGIMPLPDEPWARGKCGYKLIQYMACGLPVVASPVGVNREIVSDGINGFLAQDSAQWHKAIDTLIADTALRARMGIAGRKIVEERYSIQRYGPEVARLIQALLASQA